MLALRLDPSQPSCHFPIADSLTALQYHWQELQKIVSGRSTSSSDGLLKSFQKSKDAAGKALQQAVGTQPGSAIPAPSLSPAGSGIGESIQKAFTTSPKQIAAKAAPVVPQSGPGASLIH